MSNFGLYLVFGTAYMFTAKLPITCTLLLVSMGSYYFWRDVIKTSAASLRAAQTALVIMGVWFLIVCALYVRHVRFGM